MTLEELTEKVRELTTIVETLHHPICKWHIELRWSGCGWRLRIRKYDSDAAPEVLNENLSDDSIENFRRALSVYALKGLEGWQEQRDRAIDAVQEYTKVVESLSFFNLKTPQAQYIPAEAQADVPAQPPDDVPAQPPAPIQPQLSCKPPSPVRPPLPSVPYVPRAHAEVCSTAHF